MDSSRCTAPAGPSLSGYKHYRCRCSGCCTANRDYNRTQRRLSAYGRWNPMVDADPVRQHVQALRRYYSAERIAELAGVGSATVKALLWDVHGKRRARLRKDTADALTAVQFKPDLVPDGHLVDAAGTHRRIQSMAVRGHSLAAQSRTLGREKHYTSNLLRQPEVTARTARDICDLFDKLDRTPAIGPGADRARRYATKRGWHPAAAWDDIDNPDEQPNVGAPEDDAVDEVLVRQVLRGSAGVDRLNNNEQIELVRLWRRHRQANYETYGYKRFAQAFGITTAAAQAMFYAAGKAAPDHTAADSRTNRKVA